MPTPVARTPEPAAPPRRQEQAARPLISLRSISKAFSNGTVALRDMSLDIGARRVREPARPVGLRQIDGAPDHRRSRRADLRHDRLADRRARCLRPPAPEIGFVFQDPTLMPWATVFANVWLPLRLKGMSRSAASERGHGGARDGRPRRLRGVLSARTLRRHEDARVDRPRARSPGRSCCSWTSLSPRSTRSPASSSTTIFSMLWERFGWTVIFVTHSVFESVYLSERIVVMAARPGRVFEDVRDRRALSARRRFPHLVASTTRIAAQPPTRCMRRWKSASH